MPVSGNEEPRVIAGQSSNSSAGIPIKKRKFTPIRSLSPPPQEPSSPSVENDIIPNKHSTLSQELSLSNASVLTKSPSKVVVSKNFVSMVKKETISTCIADENMNILSELKKGSPGDTNVNSVQSNANIATDKVQEPNCTTGSGFTDDVERKEKLMQDGESLYTKTPRDTRLHLAPNEASTLNVSWEALINQQVERDCKLKLSTGLKNAMLSLEAKELLVPVSTSQNSEVTQVYDKLDPSSSCLDLIKEKPMIQFKSSDADSNNPGCQASASRSKWDLNTTMDVWEGSLGDARTRDNVDYDRSNETRGRYDRKPFISSTGMAGGVGVETRKQRLGEGEDRSNFPSLSLPSIQQCKPDDSLRLSLSMSVCQSNLGEENSGSSAKVDSDKILANLNLYGGQDSSGNTNSVGRKILKSEPLDNNANNDWVRVGSHATGLDFRTAKRLDRNSKEAAKLQNIHSHKLVEQRSIKSEPVQEVNWEIHSKIDVISDRSVGNVIKSQDNNCPPSSPLPTGSGLFANVDLSNQSGHSTCTKEVSNKCTPQGARESLGQTAAEMISITVGRELKEKSNISGDMIHSFRTEDLKVDIPETSRVKLMEELHIDSRGNDEGSVVSDEEKVSISAEMVEDDSYGSDYESDGNHDFDDDMDTQDRRSHNEDDEFEDGEVREPLVHSAVEGLGDEATEEVENIIVGDYDTAKNMDSFYLPVNSSTLQSHLDEEDSKTEDRVRKSEEHIQECVDNILSEKEDKDVDKDGCLHEQSCSTIEVTAARADEKWPVEVIGRKQNDLSGMKEFQQGHEKESSSEGASNASQGIVTTSGQATDERVKEADTVEKIDSTFPKLETPLNSSDAVKDVNGGGNRSRIINLPKGSNLTSPSKTRAIPDRLLPSRTGRERYSDFEGEHPRGNRDEYYADNSHKFVRNRIHDQPFRNSRLNFVRGRGRGSSRFSSQRGERDSDRDFAPEIYNGPGDYRFPRHNRDSAVTDAELESNDYVIAPDGAVVLVGTGRGGRRHLALNDELPSFRYSSSRRPSSGGRDGSATRGIHMVRRLPRNISPSRDEDGSDLVALRHRDKFTRGLEDDIIEPRFSHPQPPYDGLDDQFGGRNRNMSSVQRRGIPRIRTKSPIRSRTRSPGPWSSPRRRSPDGCTGLPKLTQRRSPGIYRIERMRSSDRPCFREEIVARRRGSPPYMTRSSADLRDVGSGRDHGQLRSVIPNGRSPSRRDLPRSTGRFDILNPRERVDGDDYFGGPIRSGRFQELGGDGSADERRNLGERRGLVRDFRPPYNDGAEGESFRFQLEGGPRPFRYCPEAGREFFERGSLREREFDRSFKTRPEFTPRRMRSDEEQEGNYRHGEQQVWHGNGFDDISRAKRRRF